MPSGSDGVEPHPNRRWHVIAALASELATLRGVDWCGARLLCSGPGAASAAAAAGAAVRDSSAGLLVWGFAGGLRLAPGTVVLPRAVIGIGERYVTAEPWHGRLVEVIGSTQAIAEADLYSAADVVGTPREKRALLQESGAAAVDMEAVAVARVAHAHQLPFVVVKVVLDGPFDALPADSAQWVDGDGHARLTSMLVSLRRADTWVPTLRLLRRYRGARRVLTAVARRLATADTTPPLCTPDAA